MSDYRDGSVADVKEALGRARTQIDEMMAGLNLAKDRGDSARRIIRIALEGSGRTDADIIKASIIDADNACDEAINACLLAVEHLDTFTATL